MESDLVHLVVEKVEKLLEQLGQLPASKRAPGVELPATMVGMEGFRDRVLDCLKHDNVVLLHGLGGIGKTTCAKVVYDHLKATAFKLHPAAAFYTQLQPCMTPEQLMAVQKALLLCVLGEEQTVHSCEDGLGRIRKHLAKQKVLVVVDNVWGDRLKRLLPKDLMTRVLAPGSMLLVTSREHTAVEGFITADARMPLLPMPLLSTQQAKELLCKHAFCRDSPPAEKEVLVASIVSRCGNLPQALEVVGMQLACHKDDQAWQNFDRALLTAFTTMQAERLGEAGNTTLYAAYSVSIDFLNEHQQQLLLDIAFFLVGQPWGALRAYTDYDCFTLKHLTQCALVKEEPGAVWLDSGVGMHDTIVEFCCWYESKRAAGTKDSLGVVRLGETDGDVLSQVMT
jgi:hypothetical protein